MAKREKRTGNKDRADKRALARENRRLRQRRRSEKYRRRQNSISIYFLLWAVFSALSLIIVLFSGVTQSLVLKQTYRDEVVKELSGKGTEIEGRILDGTPDVFHGNTSAFVRYLAVYYDVDIYLLDGDGTLLFPQEPHFGEDSGEEDIFDFTAEVEELKKRLAQKETDRVIFEGDGEYVYGSQIVFYGNSNTYLYVSRSMELISSMDRQMGGRLIVSGLFVFVLSFAVSSAVSGWLTRPITEITKKAKLLAQGDFNVDFHGDDYGQEMVELADTLNFARDELSKTDSMQKELIANVSHDFKTPLTMIKAYAAMIMEISGDVPEKRNKHAQVIVDEADRLTSLVADLLDLSKIQSGIEALNVREVDMSAYVYELVGRFDYLKETKGYVIETYVEDGLFSRVDELKIGQAIYNLIGNAVNYTGEDKRVFVRLERTGENVFRFSVRDTGAGIEPEETATIWERYYRSTEAHKRPVKGTGLGLSIVKAVLERHRFYFGVESEPGKGSTFFVDFPIVAESEPSDEKNT